MHKFCHNSLHFALCTDEGNLMHYLFYACIPNAFWCSMHEVHWRTRFWCVGGPIHSRLAISTARIANTVTPSIHIQSSKFIDECWDLDIWLACFCPMFYGCVWPWPETVHVVESSSVVVCEWRLYHKRVMCPHWRGTWKAEEIIQLYHLPAIDIRNDPRFDCAGASSRKEGSTKQQEFIRMAQSWRRRHRHHLHLHLHYCK